MTGKGNNDVVGGFSVATMADLIQAGESVNELMDLL
jgi:hypothetical protein